MLVKTLVIAEPGCTHEGSLETMLKLIDVAADCGADVFKNQWTSSADRMARRRNAPEYLRFYQWLQYPLDWHIKCAARCKARGMRYGCSVYLPCDATMAGVFVTMLKISSFEAEDRALIRAAHDTGLPIVISAGMANGYEHQDACWGMHGNIQWLHCTSAYPAPLDAINLRLVRDLGMRLVGLSDHSRNVITGAVAVGANASIIEAHFRLHETPSENPDYAVAFNPDEFKQYIENIRLAETLMGDGIKKIQDCEQPMLRYRVTA